MGIIVSACPTSEHVSVDAEHVCLSAGIVLVFAIHAFGYLAINEESHSDTVMMSEWLSSFYMIRCINNLSSG